MASWDDGYVTDVTYTDYFFRELMPSWIATVALLLGQRPPDLIGPLRVAELGCGLGFNDAVIAATYPAAEIWGSISPGAYRERQDPRPTHRTR